MGSLCVLGVGLESRAGATVFTDSASFLSVVAPGALFENFNGIADGNPGAVTGMNGMFSFSIDTAPFTGGLYVESGLVTTDFDDERIRISFSGGNVFAVGANIWATDFFLSTLTAPGRVSISDGQFIELEFTSSTDYIGFSSVVPITFMEIEIGDGPGGAAAWATLDNLTVGTLIPEPGTMGLLGLGLGWLGLRRRAAAKR